MAKSKAIKQNREESAAADSRILSKPIAILLSAASASRSFEIYKKIRYYNYRK